MDYVSTMELSTEMKGGGHGGDVSGFVMIPLSWPPKCEMSIIVVGRKTKEGSGAAYCDV